MSEQDKQTVRGINRMNEALLKFFASGPVKLGLLTVIVAAMGAPKRWGAGRLLGLF